MCILPDSPSGETYFVDTQIVRRGCEQGSVSAAVPHALAGGYRPISDIHDAQLPPSYRMQAGSQRRDRAACHFCL